MNLKATYSEANTFSEMQNVNSRYRKQLSEACSGSAVDCYEHHLFEMTDPSKLGTKKMIREQLAVFYPNDKIREMEQCTVDQQCKLMSLGKALISLVDKVMR